MTGKGFCVKIQLHLHAITCPGVWLCPNGEIVLQIRTLNSNVESHRIPPVFPLLFHDKFTFKKVFTGIVTLAELQRSLEREYIYAELIQWANPAGRGIILATFETNLVDVLYPAPCFKGLLAGVDVDLLMEPTKCFPGIIAPKIEISTRTGVEEVLGVCHRTHVVNPKTINSKNTSCLHRKHPVKGIIRQRRVCHSRGKIKTPTVKSHCQKKLEYECKCNCSSCHSQIDDSQIEKCYHIAKGISKCVSESPYEQREYSRAMRNPSICNTHIFDSCPVCLRYKCYFTGQCDALARKIYHDSKEKENTVKDYESFKYSYSSSSDRGLNGYSKGNDITYCINRQPTVCVTRAKRTDLQKGRERLYDNNRTDDVLECDHCCKHEGDQRRQNICKSSEMSHRKVNKQEKIRERNVVCA